MPVILDTRQPVVFYDPDTLTIELWDGSLQASTVSIGQVTANAGTNLNTSGLLTDTQLRASAVPVSGTFWQATQPVSGTFWQATQPVSGPVTDTQLRASAVPIAGPVAHDVGVSGSPVAISGVAQDLDDTAPPNQVSTEADVVRLAAARDGALFVRPFGPRIWSYHENSSNALTDASVHAAPAAGLSLYVTDIIVSLGAATALNVFFEEGASTVLGPYYLEAINGRSLHLRFATPKKITAATALTVTTSAAIAHGIDVTGFTAQG